MEKIILESHGKINLSLDVLYKREDGYHELNTIMQEIELKDTIILREINKGIEIQCNNKELPLDETNLVFKAWEKIVDKVGENRGIHITLDKQIPIAAGLGGGSSNAAAVLKGLNELWDLKLSQEELMDIGVEIGADVPFCIMGGTAHARGIGEKLTKLKPFSGKMLLLANPGIFVSTEKVYNNLDLNCGENINIEEIISFMEKGNLLKLGQNMANTMEKTVINKHPIIDEIKKDMLKHGALGSLMSGSGPTVFGLFDQEEKLHKCKEELEKKIPLVIATKTK
ncbi:MAG: 4-(cytidine 5'-diphospho)-2-C-methyl-D-erythritol kinase [Tissierellia bacterium]|nr:4-(cytidine 5'-diphospho)-2-C-methyl-D-erythritol kinase [Tissierellia bacterium]